MILGFRGRRAAARAAATRHAAPVNRPAPLPPRRPPALLRRPPALLRRPAGPAEPRSLAVAYLLWVPSAVGLFGLHRFYCRQPASGTLWLFTLGLCGAGQLVDLFLLPRMVEEANRALALEQAIARAAADAPPSLERQLLQLARDSGERGFTINDALLRVDPRAGADSREVSAEIQRLLHEHLLDVGNDERGRVVYREP